MDALQRVMHLRAQTALALNKELEVLADQQEKKLEVSRLVNRARDILERARTDNDGGGPKSFTQEEKAQVIAAAGEAGIALTDADFGDSINKAHAEHGGNAWLESPKDPALERARAAALDQVDKRIERGGRAFEEASGMLDFKMNRAMNAYTKAVQDANAVAQIDSTLKNALIPRA